MASARLLGFAVATAAALSGFGVLGACGSSDGGAGGNGGEGGAGDDGALDVYVPPVRAEFGLDTRPSNTTCKAMARPPSTAAVKWEQVFATAAPLGQPMMLAQVPGDATRWFFADRTGTVKTFSVAAPAAPTVVANLTTLSGQTVITSGEGGFLGMAFHPQFATNGKLFVTWTNNRITLPGATPAPSMHSEVGYLHSPGNDGASFDSYTPILGFDQTDATNHKGGGIAFGKDGLLYVSFGDGGQGDDFYKNGQNKNVMFAKLLRIDVDNPSGGNAYGIPATNPFAAGGGEPAVYAYGLRNPYRFSIDRDTNEVWVGDVGQNHYEEIDAKVKIGGNYGWPCREGVHDYLTADTTRCPPGTVGLIDPVVEHEHIPANSRAITGGYVYRGKAMPDFVGTYVYADYVKKEMWTLAFDPGTGAAIKTQLDAVAAPSESWVSFAEDNDGELYAVALDQGQIYKLLPAAPPGPNTFPDRLSKTGCVDPLDPKKPASGLVAYGVNSPLWSDGATKERWMALPDGTTITVNVTDGDFDFPNGTVLVKTFSVGGKRIETRLFMRHDDGAWAGYTYEWLDDQSDAVLLVSSKTKPVGTQTWAFPARNECVNCHTEASGRSLGLELGQQNGDFVYPTTNRISNQLKTLDHIGMFGAPLGKPVDQLIAFPDPLGAAPVDQRARSYLHSNCSICHRPQGGGLGNMDLRFGTAFAETKTCNVDPQQGDIGVAGAKLLVPAMPGLSVLALRPHSPAANRMPPLASSIVDDKGVKVLDDWITSVAVCP